MNTSGGGTPCDLLATVGTNSGNHSPNLLQHRIHLLFVLLLVLAMQAPWCPSVV
jgi:hypothetical protein